MFTCLLCEVTSDCLGASKCVDCPKQWVFEEQLSALCSQSRTGCWDTWVLSHDLYNLHLLLWDGKCGVSEQHKNSVILAWTLSFTFFCIRESEIWKNLLPQYILPSSCRQEGLWFGFPGSWAEGRYHGTKSCLRQWLAVAFSHDLGADVPRWTSCHMKK